MQLNEHQYREWLGKQVVDIAYQVHKAVGPGLLEKIYESCFCYELSKRQIPFESQKKLGLVYDNVVFDEALRIDLIVADQVIVELKAEDNFHPVWEAQLLSYLRLSNIGLGYLINFSVPVIKTGIKRMVL